MMRMIRLFNRKHWFCLLGGAVAVTLLGGCTQPNLVGVEAIQVVSCADDPGQPGCEPVDALETVEAEPAEAPVVVAVPEEAPLEEAPQPPRSEETPVVAQPEPPAEPVAPAPIAPEPLLTQPLPEAPPPAAPEPPEVVKAEPVPEPPPAPEPLPIVPEPQKVVKAEPLPIETPVAEALPPAVDIPEPPPVPEAPPPATPEPPEVVKAEPLPIKTPVAEALPPAVEAPESPPAAEAEELPEAPVAAPVDSADPAPAVEAELEFVGIELPASPEAPPASLEPSPASLTTAPPVTERPTPELPEYTGAFVSFSTEQRRVVPNPEGGDLEPVAETVTFPERSERDPQPPVSRPPVPLEPRQAPAVRVPGSIPAEPSAFEGRFQRFSEPEPSQRPQPVVLEPVLSDLTPRLPTGVTAPAENPFERVYRFVEKWRRLWEQEGGEAYLSLYAPDFQGGGRDLQAWREHKLTVNRLNQNRQVQLTPTRILFEGNRVYLDLLQAYQSSRLQDWGLKELELRERQDRYLIVAENWKALDQKAFQQLRQEQSLEEWAVPEMLDLQELPSF